ncbi:MAG: hypothetical protein ABIQ95_15925 [Bdellovibrionia bacterium]
MQKILTAIMLSTWLVGSSALAAEDPYYSDQPMTTTGRVKDVEGGLRNEVVGIKPQVGALVFSDQRGNTNSRIVEGFTVDGNMSNMINKDWSNLFIGPSVGVLFSHLGDPTANFLGMHPDPNSTTGGGGANLLIIPANVKVGYNIMDNLRLAAHGGGNVLYRSLISSMNLGDTTTDTGSGWSLFPNIGADAELGLGKNVALMLRPDWTVTPGATVFSGTVALNFPFT